MKEDGYHYLLISSSVFLFVEKRNDLRALTVCLPVGHVSGANWRQKPETPGIFSSFVFARFLPLSLA
jgi:hypothetical protein